MTAAGCVSPFAGDGDGDGGAGQSGLDRDLAGRPEALPTTTAPPTGTEPPPPGGGDPAPPPAGTGAPPTTAPNPEAPPDAPPNTGAGNGATDREQFGAVLSLDDAPGDHGIEGRPYGDARHLLLESSATSLRVTVTVGGELPPRLRDREVMGIGVDLYRSQPDESDFQLFAEGGSDGWFAYLDTPDGLVEYPGTFRLGGDRLQFVVPWDAIGGRRPGAARLFVDWSQGQVAVVATATSDRAPDRGTAEFTPG